MAAPWRRTSRGVVIDTRHLTRVRGTAPPLVLSLRLMSVCTGRPMARARLVEEVEVVVMLIAGSREMVASSSSAQHKGSPRRKKSLRANIDSRYKINIVSYY